MEEMKGCCVLTLPLLTQPWQEDIIDKRFNIMEHLDNSLIAMELRKLKNVQRTRKYKEIIQEINNTPEDKRKELYRKREKLLFACLLITPIV
ncbi:MAG: hypothetical protein ACI4EF_07555 [Coprococcus sp.]